MPAAFGANIIRSISDLQQSIPRLLEQVLKVN